MNSSIIDTPIDFPTIGDVEMEIRYAELCDRLRPPSLTLPVRHLDALEVLKKRMEIKAVPKASAESETSDKELSSPSSDEDRDSDDARLILRLASLQIPDPYVIPESRICTPRTPKTPATLSNRPRRTMSPVDECRGGDKTPKDLLIQRYKGFTPRRCDFLM